MKRIRKIAVGVIAASAMGAGTVAHAHPVQTGTEQHAMRGMQHGAESGMPHDMKESIGRGTMMMHGRGGPGGQQLMTPEERTALREKMRNAATPEERQQIAAATRAEMQKRAQEKGITSPEHRGPRFGRTPQAPGTSEHAH
jgi:hypothetical protein